MKEKKKKSKETNFTPIQGPSTETTPTEAEDCTICMENIKELAKLDGCEHNFCFGCINEWAKVLIHLF
jgi:hypothetical protein